MILSRDVPGQKSLSRDNLSFPCPGTKGQRDVPSRGNPSFIALRLLHYMIGPPDSPKTLKKKSQNSLQKENKEQCEKIEPSSCHLPHPNTRGAYFESFVSDQLFSGVLVA